MKANLFNDVGVFEGNSKWENCISRKSVIYKRTGEIRSEFARDYTRMLHCTAYRRLKHKTQVFFATQDDHICTRIEHVNHVASVSQSIATYLGLNPELTSAIAIGHDLGHAPFGHSGEAILRDIVKNQMGELFWHEKNSLRFIDKIETLDDPYGCKINLNLTYGVRDGIISHCGEVNENALIPRDKFIDLDRIEKPSQYSPYTWEGCVVKISDKIAYLGRDIEDALSLNILSYRQLKELRTILKMDLKEINNTILIHYFIKDLCLNSSPEKGICLSSKYLELMNQVKEFNYKNIYYHRRLDNFKEYAKLILQSIFNTLKDAYKGYDTINELKKHLNYYPTLITSFIEWLLKYSDIKDRSKRGNKFSNEVIYILDDDLNYKQAIVDYIASLTDHLAIKLFGELTGF